jgi:hypothetical protein
MAYALTVTDRNDTRYTIFENNQVLTADQLNDLHQYLNLQDRATRTKVIGVGIVGGLDIGALPSGNVVVSRGAAITTDGDLAWFDDDMEFNGFRKFADADAKYAPFMVQTDQTIGLFELVNLNPRTNDGSEPLKTFERTTNSKLSSYTGVLYLEEYELDADQCTGADCDNRGKEVIKNWRFLLVHNNQIRLLLSTLPQMNRAYFQLPDIRLQRVVLNPSIDTFAELQASFAATFVIKDGIKAGLEKLWSLCGQLTDDLLGSNPVPEWHQLLDTQFAQLEKGLFVQYLYDYCRDLADAYHELKELLFDDNSILCPKVHLFPKHVLLGEVKNAVALPQINNRFSSSRSNFSFASLSSILRFRHNHFDNDTRHLFYESPVLNAKGERLQQVRFGMVRINTLIRSFSVPGTAAIGNAARIRITPSPFMDKPLGNRAIPYYFGFGKDSANVPAYWCLAANVRNREDLHRAYFAENYSRNAFATQPFAFDGGEVEFYRIEGHIGFKYPEVEKRLNDIITQHNLPINIVTIQVERNLLTVPIKPWYFNYLHHYELIQRRSIIDQLSQAELTHNSLAEELKRDNSRSADLAQINPILNTFNTAKANFANTWGGTNRAANTQQFVAEVEALSKTAGDFKMSTRQFSFSNTAAPHDFVINTNSHIKLDLINDLINQQIDRKKNELLLGNFLVKNPGLEHAAGVLRGGTFVLVYTANDQVVVADFMLPYATIDHDLVPPPTIKPIPIKPRYELPKLFEKIPQYEGLFNRKLADLDSRFAKVNTDFASTLDLFNKDFSQRHKNTETLVASRMMDFDSRFANVNETIDSKVTRQVTGKFEDVTKEFKTTVQTTLEREQNKFYNSFISTIKFEPGKTTGVNTPGRTGVVLADVDVTPTIERMRDITQEIRQNPNMTPDVRKQREGELGKLSAELNNLTSRAAQLGMDADTMSRVKAIQFDMNEALNVITDVGMRSNIGNINNQMRNTIVRGGFR